MHGQRSASVLRHTENTPRAQPTIRPRIAARGEHSARTRQRSARILRHAENTPHAQPTIRTRVAARGEHSARAANESYAYCGTRRTFRARSQRSSRVLRHAENTPYAQPTIRTRIAAHGEHFARAANDPHVYCVKPGIPCGAGNMRNPYWEQSISLLKYALRMLKKTINPAKKAINSC